MDKDQRNRKLTGNEKESKKARRDSTKIELFVEGEISKEFAIASY